MTFKRNPLLVCKNCRFLVVQEGEEFGECRRHSPATGRRFPFITDVEGDWCGDFKTIFTPADPEWDDMTEEADLK